MRTFTGMVFLILATNVQSQNLPMAIGLEGPGVRWSHPFLENMEVKRVTNLDPSYTTSGSLANALAGGGNKVIVFDISGTIDRTGYDFMTTTGEYTVIAGQTAPSPGVTVEGGGLIVRHPHVLIQHIRFRTGNNGEFPDLDSRDNIEVNANARNISSVIVDHVSVSWGVDENISVYASNPNTYSTDDVTFSYMISSEGLYNDGHTANPHSMGMSAGSITGGGIDNIMFAWNFIAHCNARSPRSQAINFASVNNYVYNVGARACNLINLGGVATFNSIVGNFFEAGENTTSDSQPIHIENNVISDSEVYLDDNTGPDFAQIVYNDGLGEIVNEPPYWPSGVVALPSNQIKEHLLVSAGARPVDRDAVDVRIVQDARDGTGSFIDDESEVGGWPTLPVNSRMMEIANPNSDDDSDGYYNWEEFYLHWFAVQVQRWPQVYKAQLIN